MKFGKRKGVKKKSKLFSCETKKLIRKKIESQTNISEYFFKLKRSPSEDSQLPEVLIPNPDAATLPSSTCLGSFHRGKGKSHNNDDQFRSSNISFSSPIHSVPKCLDINNDASKRKNSKRMGIFTNKDRQLTEFFPIRRSNRTTSCNLLKERARSFENAVITGKEEGFRVKEFPCKGRGVISEKNIKCGEFVLEYHGELIDMEKAKEREIMYASKENIGCYMYYFKYNNKGYCVDATRETNRLGRLINHSKKGNLKTQVFFIQGCPHLIFIARKDIHKEEELLYDYGDRSKLALESHPWLAA